MKNSGILRKLAEVEAVDAPFISVYLNAEPNQHGRDDFDVFLKKQLSEHQDDYEEHTEDRENFDRDVKRIADYAKKIDASANGVAIFACAGADDFFQTIEFDVPFENDRFFVFDKPHLFPLAKLIDRNPRFAVVLADSNMARIYVFQHGRILEGEDVENEKFNRSEVGGWSQMRFQRHIDELRKQHFKEVVDELDKIVREENITRVVLAGNEEVAIPLVREELTSFLEDKIVGTIRLPIDTPENEILDEAETAVNQNNTLTDKEKIDELFDQNYDEGLGVTGVADTLKALENGQVQELFLSAKFDEIEYDENEIKKILENYAPGNEGETPSVKESRQIADELLRLALYSAEQIRFIEDENLLEEVGGVGALLRYTMSANQNA